MHRAATRIAAAIFILVAIAHLLRLIFHVPVIIAGWPLPIWISIIGILVPGVLATALLRE